MARYSDQWLLQPTSTYVPKFNEYLAAHKLKKAEEDTQRLKIMDKALADAKFEITGIEEHQGNYQHLDQSKRVGELKQHYYGKLNEIRR